MGKTKFQKEWQRGTACNSKLDVKSRVGVVQQYEERERDLKNVKEQEVLHIATIAMVCSTLASLWKFQFCQI